jgi:hypothetical protein
MVTEQQINLENTVNTEIPPAFFPLPISPVSTEQKCLLKTERVSNFLGGRTDDDFMLKKFV